MCAREESPNKEQQRWLKRVTERCEVEAHELLKQGPYTEPLRTCLMGIPGAGNSTCIKLIREYFESVLGWEDGVQFQFLTTQNAMAAMIEGDVIRNKLSMVIVIGYRLSLSVIGVCTGSTCRHAKRFTFSRFTVLLHCFTCANNGENNDPV